MRVAPGPGSRIGSASAFGRKDGGGIEPFATDAVCVVVVRRAEAARLAGAAVGLASEGGVALARGRRGAAVFARLVPLGEMAAGVALILGVWTSLAAFLAFVMVMNIHVASGALFTYAFLTNGYGLPVVGSTLGLAIGGIRLPWSLRK